MQKFRPQRGSYRGHRTTPICAKIGKSYWDYSYIKFVPRKDKGQNRMHNFRPHRGRYNGLRKHFNVVVHGPHPTHWSIRYW